MGSTKASESPPSVAGLSSPSPSVPLFSAEKAEVQRNELDLRRANERLTQELMGLTDHAKALESENDRLRESNIQLRHRVDNTAPAKITLGSVRRPGLSSGSQSSASLQS